ncbi:MAG: alpha-1,2-fucosyltransferase [Elusimicrobia bacterium]|nr:alpha-1,2-fucosyltransferase [Elusimicrobiota bacterium]
MNKIIVRLRGGLGNQLFEYAVARRLALVNNAELVIDNVTGFIRDTRRYRCILNHFNITSRMANKRERLEPFERYRRGIKKYLSRIKPFFERSYLEQDRKDFDKRMIGLKVRGQLYLDGLWQSEDYFKDIESVIREDLRIVSFMNERNQNIAKHIRSTKAVALHMRCFEMSGNTDEHNVSADYYKRAIALMEVKVELPNYFLFSDNPEFAFENINLPKDRITRVSHNKGDENAYADLWLMSQCQHFIIANSTFSWWGAWLGDNPNKIIMAPKKHLNYFGQIPSSWVKL